MGSVVTADLAATVGARIRVRRESVGLTQTDLAVRIGVAQSAISLWEGGRRSLDITDLSRIAVALGMPPAALLEGVAPDARVHAADYLLALREITENLEEYIEKRAAELAEPRIAEERTDLEAEVDTLTTSLAMAEQRQEDLIAEFRRQLDARDRQVRRYHDWLRQHGISPLTGAKEEVRNGR